LRPEAETEKDMTVDPGSWMMSLTSQDWHGCSGPWREGGQGWQMPRGPAIFRGPAGPRRSAMNLWRI